jgi:hypothetical protein
MAPQARLKTRVDRERSGVIATDFSATFHGNKAAAIKACSDYRPACRVVKLFAFRRVAQLFAVWIQFRVPSQDDD